jgi:protein-tyrosine phosphatase
MSEILKDFLFLGDHISASDKCQLAGLGITHIIDATNSLSFTSQRIAYELGIIHLPIAIWDSEEVNIIDEEIPKIINFIRKAKEKNNNIKETEEKAKENRILIHCQAGISKSVSLLISYLITDSSMSLKTDAMIHVLKTTTINSSK